eukprot:COSAG06_NODE_4050_length_4631_cov_2.710062_4_plen_160_part_00
MCNLPVDSLPLKFASLKRRPLTHDLLQYRISKIAANGTVIDRRYWDTYAFLGTEGPGLPADVNWGATVSGMGSPAGSDIGTKRKRPSLCSASSGYVDHHLPRQARDKHVRKPHHKKWTALAAIDFYEHILILKTYWDDEFKVCAKTLFTPQVLCEASHH